MVLPSARARLAFGLLLAGIVTQPLAAQGLGASASLGLYRSNSTASYANNPGIGAEFRGHWSFPSGFVLGLGARGLRFQNGDRATVFLDGRYAPVPTLAQRIRPVLGVRGGPFLAMVSASPWWATSGSPSPAATTATLRAVSFPA